MGRVGVSLRARNVWVVVLKILAVLASSVAGAGFGRLASRCPWDSAGRNRRGGRARRRCGPDHTDGGHRLGAVRSDGPGPPDGHRPSGATIDSQGQKGAVAGGATVNVKTHRQGHDPDTLSTGISRHSATGPS